MEFVSLRFPIRLILLILSKNPGPILSNPESKPDGNRISTEGNEANEENLPRATSDTRRSANMDETIGADFHINPRPRRKSRQGRNENSPVLR